MIPSYKNYCQTYVHSKKIRVQKYILLITVVIASTLKYRHIFKFLTSCMKNIDENFL